MSESPQDQGLSASGKAYKSASPSNYWGRGSFVLPLETTSPESPAETSSADQEATQSPTPQESKPS